MNIWFVCLCQQPIAKHIYVYCLVATSIGCANHDRSKGGRQVTEYQELQSLHLAEVGVDGLFKLGFRVRTKPSLFTQIDTFLIVLIFFRCLLICRMRF